MAPQVGTASKKQNILILGGTGPTGIHGIRYALERGHNVTAYARSPEKLPADVASNVNLKIVKGEISNEDVHSILAPVIKAGNFDSIVSFLGYNSMSAKGNAFLTFYTSLLGLLRPMTPAARPYLVIVHTVSIADDNDGFSLLGMLLVGFIRLFAGAIWGELQDLKQLWRGEEDVEWTVARLGMLNDGGLTRSEGARAGWIAKDGYGFSMSKQDISLWCVLEVENRQWVRRMPALYSGV